MYIIYIIQSKKNKKYYIGYTSDIKNRLFYHNSGKNKSTKSGRPWKIVHEEKFTDKKLAWIRERQIKSYKGGNALKKLVSK